VAWFLAGWSPRQGFDSSVLSEWRNRLAEQGLANKLLDVMLLRFQEKNLIKHRGKQRTDSTQIIAAIRQVNRLELAGETLRAALNEIATVAPEWLKQIISEDWYERYRWRFDDYRLPKKKNEREQLARQIGLDGHYLLDQVWRLNEELEVRHLWSLEVLRRVWVQQYTFINEQLVWRNPDSSGLPPNSICIESPYDIEARNSSKRGMNWTGQAKSQTGFDVSTFVIDWDKQVVQCPQGHLSRLWRNSHDTNGNPLVEVVFDRHTCGACSVRNNCTSSALAPRKLKLRPQAEYQALAARRIEQLSQEFKLRYASRSGIEGTI
jgi:hypothetical protein